MSIPVSGMTCASCATRVEKVLARLPGVASARVNLAEDRVALEREAPLEAIARALFRAGYGLREEVWAGASRE